MTEAAVQSSICTICAAQENKACRLPAYFGISLGLCELKCLKTKPGVTVLSRKHDASHIHNMNACGEGGQSPQNQRVTASIREFIKADDCTRAHTPAHVNHHALTRAANNLASTATLPRRGHLNCSWWTGMYPTLRELSDPSEPRKAEPRLVVTPHTRFCTHKLEELSWTWRLEQQNKPGTTPWR